MADEEAPDVVLSPELAASLGGSGGDALMLGARKKQKSGGGGAAKHGPRRGNALPLVKKLSKSQKRKLAKVEEDKRKREQRAGVVARLNAAKLVSDESLTLLQGSDRMGQRMSKRETLRRELKAERAGIALPGTENSRLLKREKPEGEVGGGDDDDSDDESSSDDDDSKSTFGRKQSWPNKNLQAATTPAPKDTYGPIHPLDQARLDLERIKNAETELMQGEESDDEEDDENIAEAREKFNAYLQSARALADLIRQRDPEQLNERNIEKLGPNAVAASLDPKDAVAQAQAANEAAANAANKKYPGVFVGASFSVAVDRTEKIQTQREGLPILGSEHDIVECINSNPITVICGETGCGKTTQVPQFLYEAGYGALNCSAHPGAIAVTQPRRVAVTSTATRVADELNVKLAQEVGYQVRYDKKVSSDTTSIKFMTDGVLLKEMQSDLLLRKYSVVIIDEAHERGVNTDILLGLLSRVVPLRAELTREGRAMDGKPITPLRLVVMSATLRVSEFVENKKLCPTPPALLRVAARQFPVTVHFSRETVHGDYVSAAKKKVLAIHRKLPPGGILVFVTGQREVEQLCKKLKAAFPKPGEVVGKGYVKTDKNDSNDSAQLDQFSVDALDAAGEDFDEDLGGEDTRGDVRDDFNDDSDDEDAASDVSEEDDVVVHGGEGVTPEEAQEAEATWIRAHAPTTELENKQNDGSSSKKEEEDGPGYLHVLPLYAMLPPDLQKRVFDPPPKGARVVVVATNVAETSLTIPNTRYVIDAGREKRRVFNSGNEVSDEMDNASQNAGMSRFEVGWVSKASAEQRAGRAGRTGPGHCYRLFSSAHFVNDLDDHAAPQILCQPVEGVVLQMRAMGIDRVDRFPFLTPPGVMSLKRAQRTLAVLGALRSANGSRNSKSTQNNFGHFGSFGEDSNDVGILTDLGKHMASLPIGVRHARMLLAAAEFEKNAEGCLAAAVVATAALSLDSPFLRDDKAGDDSGDKEAIARRRKLRHKFHHPHSDALSAARALVEYDKQPSPRAKDTFCVEHCLHGKTMREASDLRRQLLRALTRNSKDLSNAFTAKAKASLDKSWVYVNARHTKGDDPASSALRVSGEGGDSSHSKSAKEKKRPSDSKDSSNASGDAYLRKALLSGWADRVARRVKANELTDQERDTGGHTKAVRYKPALLNQTVYLHPSSALHKTSPEFLAYVDLQQTEKRAYLGGATAVDAAWLADHASALTSPGPLLEDPPPRYVQTSGTVVAFTQPHFGHHRWKMPLRASLMCAVDGGCGAFAAALLSGAVSPPFTELRDKLAAKPVLCARPEGKTQRRVGELVHQLQHRQVASKADLIMQWRNDPAWLMAQLRDWMRRGHEHVLERWWPKIVASVLGGGGGVGVGGVDGVCGMHNASQGLTGTYDQSDLSMKTSAGHTRDATTKSKKPKDQSKKKRKANPAALDGGLSIWD